MRLFAWLFLLGALLLPGRPIWAAAYLLAGTWLLARWALQRSLSRLAVSRHLSDQRIFHGEHVDVTIRLANRTGLPIPWLQVTESRPNPLAVGTFDAIASLRAGEEVAFSYRLDGNRRGVYQVGPLQLEAGDPFGFERRKRREPAPDRVIVYPRVTPLPALGLPAHLPLGEVRAPRRLHEDPAWIAGARPYSPGDPLRRVHWPATARTGELVSRQYRYSNLLPAAVCLNLSRADYTGRLIGRVELAVIAAASLAWHLAERKQQVALLAAATVREEEGPAAPSGGPAAPSGGPAALHGGLAALQGGLAAPSGGLAALHGPVALPLRQGRQGLIAILELLARVEPALSGRPFASLLTTEARRLPRGTLLLIVTPEETPETAAACAALVRSGRGVLLFVLEGAAGHRPGGYTVWTLRETARGEVEVG